MLINSNYSFFLFCFFYKNQSSTVRISSFFGENEAFMRINSNFSFFLFLNKTETVQETHQPFIML